MERGGGIKAIFAIESLVGAKKKPLNIFSATADRDFYVSLFINLTFFAYRFFVAFKNHCFSIFTVTCIWLHSVVINVISSKVSRRIESHQNNKKNFTKKN